MFLPIQFGIAVQCNSRDVEQECDSGKVCDARHHCYRDHHKYDLSAPGSEA
jgi:hypothetical protein